MGESPGGWPDFRVMSSFMPCSCIPPTHRYSVHQHPKNIHILINDYVHLITGCLQHCKRVNFENSSCDQCLLLLFRLSTICIELAETWLQNVRDTCLHHKIFWMPLSLHRKSNFVKKYQKAEETGQMCPDAKEVLLGQPGAATKVRNIR